jgi:choline dehydrogenase
MISGLGPADLLRQHDIKVVANRPGVGQNIRPCIPWHHVQGKCPDCNLDV